MIKLLFWLAFFLLFFIYIGYPIVIGLLASIMKNTIKSDDNYKPTVSILIAAYNEEDDIESTLRNKVHQDYPGDLIEIWVVSDESTDRTDEIVSNFAETSPVPVFLFRQVPRQGKTSGLNRLVTQAKGDILIFSDANSCWSPDAVSKLVRNFADKDVGYVTGKMIYVTGDGSLVGDGCSSYMRYENWLRERETAIGSIVGVDGGVDAMRKNLYTPLSPDQLPDFVQPLKVVEQGYRVIYEPGALLRELALSDTENEYRMRVRVSLRAIWALHDMRSLMSLFRYGRFAFQLILHKLLRYLAFIPLMLAFLCNVILVKESYFYQTTLFAQVVFYGLAWAGHRRKDFKNLSSFYWVPYYFCLLNISSAHAAWRYMKGEKQVLWTPRSG